MSKKVMRYFAVIVLGALLGGCATPNMKHSDIGPAVTAPEAGKALVIFMRPRSLGFKVTAAVFDDVKFIGFVPYSTQLAYQAAPGRHRFMVVSEAADFMDADLVAGRTYYAEVAPRMGAWRARFTLLPVHRERLKDGSITDCIAECKFVTNKDSAHQWASTSRESIVDKRGKYLEVWMQKNPADRPYLRPEDGQ